MAVVFPTTLDTLTNPVSTDTTTAVDHALQHANANDAIEALEARVGITGSAVTSSLTYRIATLEAPTTPTFTGVTYAGNHSDYAGIQGCGYTKTSGILVTVRGVVKATGTNTGPATFATLPSGYRPSAERRFPCVLNDVTVSSIRVATTGVMSMIANTVINDYFSTEFSFYV